MILVAACGIKDPVLKCTCFTSAKVQILTRVRRQVRREVPEAVRKCQVLSLLALLVQKYKH
jgi:hypothetical protein